MEDGGDDGVVVEEKIDSGDEVGWEGEGRWWWWGDEGEGGEGVGEEGAVVRDEVGEGRVVGGGPGGGAEAVPEGWLGGERAEMGGGTADGGEGRAVEEAKDVDEDVGREGGE